MRLTAEQIRAVTVGAVAITEAADGIHFEKCTQKQLDAWDAQREDLGARARTTTGVRLEFHTDSPTLSFGATVGNKFELYVNGIFRQQFHLNDTDRRAEVRLTEGEGENRVTLYFPAHESGVLEFVELADGATVQPHAFDRRILFVGDSITQGWESHYDSFAYAPRVSRFFNADSVIQGIGGAYFHESTFDKLPFDPDWVIMAYGTNDFGHYKSLDELRAHTSAHLSLIAEEYRGKRLIYISPIWRAKQEKTMGTFRQARAALIDEATRLGFEHIDGLTLVPSDLMLFTDGLHPNELGFSFYAEALCRQLLK